MAKIRVGKPDVAIDASAHTPGVPQGNAKGTSKQQVGHHADGTADARRSTGIEPARRDPLLAVMPNISPG